MDGFMTKSLARHSKVPFLALAALLLTVAFDTAFAERCVVGLTLSGSKRAAAMAVADVVSINAYADLATCNREMAATADALPHTSAANAFPADSLTFTCKVPTDCVVSDAHASEPFNRVVPLHAINPQQSRNP